MKKMKKSFLTKSALLFGASALLLLMSTVGSTRAALTYYSENYEMRIEISSIGVSLLENGDMVTSRDYVENDWRETTGRENEGKLLTKLVDTKNGEKLVLGKEYPEKLTVRNSGAIDSYVRVILYKNWTEGEKEEGQEGENETPKGLEREELSPDLIHLNLLLENGWVEDTKASTPERTVLYYTRILPSGAESTPFSDTLQIDPSIGTKVTETRTPVIENGETVGTTVTTTFAYDGYEFHIKAEVDAVQTHNAVEAIRSAWGVDVEIAGEGPEKGNLKLINGGTGSTRTDAEQPGGEQQPEEPNPEQPGGQQPDESNPEQP